jgi:hypothetical protein
MRSVRVRQAEFPGVDGQPLPMEIYEAIAPISDPPPVVVLVEGYPDPGFVKHVGCRFMEMEWTISMAQLIAASGMRAITHSNRDAKADAVALMSHVAKVHGSRIGIWATSGHGPVAMHALGYAACGVFINPVVSESAPGKPMFIVRSGKDETPGLNAALDRFVALALESNHPMWLVNHPDAPHSFDLHHDSDTTRHILRQGLAFLRLYLGRQEGQS